MKKLFVLTVVLCLIFTSCKKAEPGSLNESIENTVKTTVPPITISTAEATYALTPCDPIIVTENTVLNAQEYSVGMRPENLIIVKSGASVELNDISIDKVQDNSQLPLQTETGNALLVSEDSSNVNINNSILTGETPYSHAVYLCGSNSSANIIESGLSVTGPNSNALYLIGSNASVSDSTLISTGEAGAALYIDSGIASCSKTRITTRESDAADAVVINNGVLSAQDCTIDGNSHFDGESELTLHNSSFIGTFYSSSFISSVILRLTEYSSMICACDDSVCGIELYLDRTCSLELQSDIYLDSLTMEDSDFSIIKDNGFSIYYNSENTANGWLEGKIYPLQNGGCIAPMI